MMLWRLPSLIAFWNVDALSILVDLQDGHVIINVSSIYHAQLRLTGLHGRTLLYAWLIVITFGWHMASPVLFLRFTDKLTWKQILEFIGLNRVDLRGLFVVLPATAYCAQSPPCPICNGSGIRSSDFFNRCLRSTCPITQFFKMGPDGLYSFPPFALLFLFSPGALAVQ